MGFLDSLLNVVDTVKSKCEDNFSDYRDGYSSGSSKYSSMSDSELMRRAKNQNFSGSSSKKIGEAKAMGDELKRRGLR